MEAQEVGNRVRRLAGDSSVSERRLSLPQGGWDCWGGGISGQVVSIRNILELEGWESFAVEAKGSASNCSLCVPPTFGWTSTCSWFLYWRQYLKNTEFPVRWVLRDRRRLPCKLAYRFNHFSFSSNLLNHLYQEIVFLTLLAVIP